MLEEPFLNEVPVDLDCLFLVSSGFATQPFRFVTNRLDSIEAIADFNRIQSSSLADQHKAAIT